MLSFLKCNNTLMMWTKKCLIPLSFMSWMQCEISSSFVLYYIFKGGNLMQSEMFALWGERKDLRKWYSLEFICFYIGTFNKKYVLQVWNQRSLLLIFGDKKLDFCKFGVRSVSLTAFVQFDVLMFRILRTMTIYTM